MKKTFFDDSFEAVFEAVVAGDQVAVGGHNFAVLERNGVHLRLQSDSGQIFNLSLSKDGDSVTVKLDGRYHDLTILNERQRRRQLRKLGQGGGGNSIVAPMPGRVVKIEVEVGQTVEPGQGVVVVEAMKMENEYKASIKAVVDQIVVAPGDVVEAGQALVLLKEEAS